MYSSSAPSYPISRALRSECFSIVSKKLLAARDVEYPVKFLHGPVVQLAQRPGTGTVVSGRKLSVNLLIVLVDPLPNRTLLGMQLGFTSFGVTQ